MRGPDIEGEVSGAASAGVAGAAAAGAGVATCAGKRAGNDRKIDRQKTRLALGAMDILNGFLSSLKLRNRSQQALGTAEDGLQSKEVFAGTMKEV